MTANHERHSENAFCMQFHELEKELNAKLRLIDKPAEYVSTPEEMKNLKSAGKSVQIYIYYPLEYAADYHLGYLRKYLNGPKRVLFVGMNPSTDGMLQHGIPFGNMSTVRRMGLQGEIKIPPQLHPDIKIEGMSWQKEEQSGERLWQLFEEMLSANPSNESEDFLDKFFKECFVHNFCPLGLYNANGKYLSPEDMTVEYKDYRKQMEEECLEILEKQLELLQPKIVIALGGYVHGLLEKKSAYCKKHLLLKMLHPSPKSSARSIFKKESKELLLNYNIFSENI
ncbi:single-strand selective monofunctional uracil DNA glycosylase-like [Musca autumnalis]|uniref:single-strand selective monofunctional uracil DNA glycosylase-like n=1 Tax=Musca autumnalis TaxID=221902 RepID=UPI003CF9775F